MCHAPFSLSSCSQGGGEFQNSFLVNLRAVRSDLSGAEVRPQVHREHRLRAVRRLQCHHGGRPSQHAHRYDQQLVPGDRGRQIRLKGYNAVNKSIRIIV